MRSRKGQQYRHLEAFILMVLAEGEIHGGAIHAALTERLPVFKADTGAVYRALQQLEQKGEVSFTWDMGMRGPARKIYQITSAGWEKLEFWKDDIEMRLRNLNYFITAYDDLKARRSSGQA